MAVNGDRVNDQVRDLVVAALDTPELTERLRRRADDAPDLLARLATDEKELELLAGDLGSGEITRAEWKAARTPIVARIDAARGQLNRRTRTTALDGFTGTADQMQARWERLNVAQRRAVVQSVIESIVVNKPQKANRYDPNRFEVIWR